MATLLKGPWQRRETAYAVWRELWPDLPLLPSPALERLIAELTAEVRGLQVHLGQEPARDPRLWLLGFIGQAGLEWPPQSPQDYRGIFAALKSKKTQLMTKARRGDCLSDAQRKKLWAIIRDPRHPHIDEELVYQLIRAEYPKARRKGPGGGWQPSMSALTGREAHELIEALLHPTRARCGRRRA